MKKTTLILLSVILAGMAFGQTAVPPQSTVPDQQYVLVPAPAANKPVNTQKPIQNQFSEIGGAIGSSLSGLVEAIGGATGKTVDKTGEVTGALVDKSGQVVSSVMDRTFGKDVTLVQGIDNVSKTEAGRFTMLVVAWKVMGKDAVDLLSRFIGVIIGVSIQIVIVSVGVWITRRFWITRSIVVKSEGPFWNKTKTYEIINSKNETDRTEGLFLTWIICILVTGINIFAVIL